MKDLTKIEEILLLSIWKLKDEAYGYKIRHHVSGIIKKDFTYGNLYSALSQLTKKKYVIKRKGKSTPARRGKIRIFYTLSSSGHKALESAFEMNQRLWDGIAKYVFETNGK